MEKISAFMDGEIDGLEAGGQVARLKEDPHLRASWDTYHLIGDTLRGEKLSLSRDFTAKVSARLAEEPTVLAPRNRAPLRATVRRFALPVAASVGGMALVAWLAVFNNPFAPPKENLAKVKGPFLVIHDKRDPVVSFENGEELFNLLPSPKIFWTVDSGHHVGVFGLSTLDNRKRFLTLLQGP